MIIRPSISRGTSTQKAINYLLADKDHNNEKRDIVKVVLGSPKLTSQIGKDYDKRSKRPYTSGVISFADSNKLDSEKVEQIVKRHQELLLGSNVGNVNCLYVQHSNKDSSHNHIHFLINNINLEDNRAFNPYPFHSKKGNKYAQAFNEATQRVIAHEFNLVQVPTAKNANFAKRAVDFQLTKYSKNINTAFSKLKQFEKIIKDGIKSGEITNREQLIETLQDAGVKFSRIGDNYISIDKSTFKDNSVDRNLRLSVKHSAIFSVDSQQAFAELRETLNTKTELVYTDKQYQKDLSFIADFTERRNNYNSQPNEKWQTSAEFRQENSVAVAVASVAKKEEHRQPHNSPTTAPDSQPQAPGLQAVSSSNSGSIDDQITAMSSQIAQAERQFGAMSMQVIKLKVQLSKLIQQKAEQETMRRQQENEQNNSRRMKI